MGKRTLTLKRNRDAKGGKLNVSISIGHRMNKRLQSEIDRMVKATESELIRLFERDDFAGDYAMDDNIGSQARILLAKLWRRFEQVFTRIAYPLTEAMLKGVDVNSAATLKSSLARISEDLTIPIDAMTPQLREVIAASRIAGGRDREGLWAYLRVVWRSCAGC